MVLHSLNGCGPGAVPGPHFPGPGIAETWVQYARGPGCCYTWAIYTHIYIYIYGWLPGALLKTRLCPGLGCTREPGPGIPEPRVLALREALAA